MIDKQTDELLLIDLSGIAHQLFHVSGNEPDPNFIATQTTARVRALASQHPHAAVCCDSGKSFRATIDPAYKAQRDTENRGVLKHQMDLACETLAKDGFPIWRVPTFEADDLIATATAAALAIADTTVLIASADKDLCQLVGPRVRIKSTAPNSDGAIRDAAAVREKFGVEPAQMLDYLSLVGDASDNIKGALGIGSVTAKDLLVTFGDLASTYKAIFAKIPHEEAKAIMDAYAKAGEPERKKIKRDLEARAPVTPSVFLSLVEFFPRHLTVRSLIALRTDAPIPFAEIAAERTPPEMTGFIEDDIHAAASAPSSPAHTSAGKEAAALQPSEPNGGTSAILAPTSPRQEVVELMPAPPAPAEFSLQLEPRTMNEAIQLAQRMFDSRLFSAYGTPQAVLATVLAGRELGIPAMASLRAFHIIEGKPQLSAGIIQSLVLKSGKASYFRCSERTDLRATFVTKRGDDPELALSYTIEEGRQAWSKDDLAWKKSGWGRNPADMLVARASSKLARLVYPDVVSGLYAPEEMD